MITEFGLFETVLVMESSDVDSEYKLRAATARLIVQNQSMHDFDVIFRETRTHTNSDHRHNSKQFLSSSGAAVSVSEMNRKLSPNTCRILRKKLELKAGRAKRNYAQLGKKSQAANLIPISRLSIPTNLEKPLVDYNSESSENVEEVSFFASKLKSNRRQPHSQLSSFSSIEDIKTESDQDLNESDCQNLELSPPLSKANYLFKILSWFNCKSLNI